MNFVRVHLLKPSSDPGFLIPTFFITPYFYVFKPEFDIKIVETLFNYKKKNQIKKELFSAWPLGT